MSDYLKRLAGALKKREAPMGPDAWDWQQFADMSPTGSVNAPGGVSQPQEREQSQLLGKLLAGASMLPGPSGDLLGPLSDAYMYATEPESRTPGNFALSALGALPFVPSMAGAWRPAFHGTTKMFDDFDIAKAMSASGHESANVPGIWAASRPEIAQMYTVDTVIDKTPVKRYGPAGAGLRAIGYRNTLPGANIRPVKINLENPLVLGNAEAQQLIFGSADQDWREAGAEFAKVARDAMTAGHDGILIKGNPMSNVLELRSDNFLVFDPKKIKSKFEK